MRTRLFIAALLSSAAAFAQQSAITIGTSVIGPRYYVDGQVYTGNQQFFWVTGSRHVLQFEIGYDPNTGLPLPYQSDSSGVYRYSFSGWKDNLGLNLAASPQLVLTASPAFTSVVAQVGVSQVLHIRYPNVPVQDLTSVTAATCQPDNLVKLNIPGIVYVDSQCVPFSADLYVAQGEHVFTAYPFTGQVFQGWYSNSSLLNLPNLTRLTLTYDMSVQANFQPAKRVRFRTDPPGLKVIFDNTEVSTPVPTFGSCSPQDRATFTPTPPNAIPLCPAEFDVAQGSKHQVSVTLQQADSFFRRQVFSKFSNGMKPGDYWVANSAANYPDDITAIFIPGVAYTIFSMPGNAPFELDGRANPLTTNVVWGVGETHRVKAPLTYTDASNRVWKFVKWSNGGDAEQSIVVPSDPETITNGVALSATYEPLGQAIVTSVPVGLKFNIDGADCVTPCVLDKSAGTQAVVKIPLSVAVTDGVRYDFDSWQPVTAGTSRVTLTFSSAAQTYTARYKASFKLTAIADPADGATFSIGPDSPDGYYASGTQVSIAATPKNGYKFRQWDGDLYGSIASGTVTMDSPKVVAARLDKIPVVPTVSVMSAAGPTPDGTVAPGSIISIFGDNLASDYVAGPVNPLAQTIAGVTVTVADRLLPLLFVSPGQINAQLISTLPDGDYTMVVHILGAQDVKGLFKVRRNAPALFFQPTAGTNFAVAVHEDGTRVSIDSPAKPSETITLYGTGFGPLDKPVIDGFILPSPEQYKLVDPIELASGAPLAFSGAGLAPGVVGLDVVRVRVPQEAAVASVDLAVKSGGRTSNTVTIPVAQ